MPLLPIKDRDGDKEASTAGRKQTDKNPTWQPGAWKPPGSTVESCWKSRESLPSSIAITYVLFTADKEI